MDKNKKNKKHLWFKAKTYGWGWTPCTWEGWLVTAIYIGLILLPTRNIKPDTTVANIMSAYFLPFALSTIVFIFVASMTGEKPRWQWGKPKSKTQ